MKSRFEKESTVPNDDSTMNLFCVNSPVLLRSANSLGNFGFASPVVPFEKLDETTAHFDVFHQIATAPVVYRDASMDSNSMSSSRSSSPIESSSTTPSTVATNSPQKTPSESPLVFASAPITTTVSLASPPLSPSALYRAIQVESHLKEMDIPSLNEEMHTEFSAPLPLMRVGLTQFQPSQPIFTDKLPDNTFIFGKRAQSSEPEEGEEEVEPVAERRTARYISNNSYNTGHGRDAASRKVRPRTVVTVNPDPELENQRRKRLDRKAELARVSRQQRNDYINQLTGKLGLLKARLALYEDENGHALYASQFVAEEESFDFKKKVFGSNERVRGDRSCK